MRNMLTTLLPAYGQPASAFCARVKAYVPVALALGTVAMGALAAGAPVFRVPVWGGK